MAKRKNKKVSNEPRVPTSFQEYYAPFSGEDYTQIDSDTPPEVVDEIMAIKADRERRKVMIAIAAQSSDIPEMIEPSDILHLEEYA